MEIEECDAYALFAYALFAVDVITGICANAVQFPGVHIPISVESNSEPKPRRRQSNEIIKIDFHLINEFNPRRLVRKESFLSCLDGTVRRCRQRRPPTTASPSTHGGYDPLHLGTLPSAITTRMERGLSIIVFVEDSLFPRLFKKSAQIFSGDLFVPPRVGKPVASIHERSALGNSYQSHIFVAVPRLRSVRGIWRGQLCGGIPEHDQEPIGLQRSFNTIAMDPLLWRMER